MRPARRFSSRSCWRSSPWRLSGESLSVDLIRTRKVELLYWIAILFSNTLGTALGDFLADSSAGFGGGALLIGGLR